MKAICLIFSRLCNMHVIQILKRILELIKHYGLTTKRFEKMLIGFIELTQKYDIIPTFPVTAMIVKKNAEFFTKINSESVDWAVHGLFHIDHTHVSFKTVKTHYNKAKDIFQSINLSFSGFRFPFLRRNWSCIDELQNHQYLWDSSEAFLWDVIDQHSLTKNQKKAYDKIVESYHPLNEKSDVCLPMMRNQLVEIPVSLPDDDMLIARLNQTKTEEIFKPWKNALQKVRERGEHFTLQVHPERFFKYKKALEQLIKEVKGDSDVYIASLTEIANWWRDKKTFRFEIKKVSKTKYKIHVECHKRSTILIKNSIEHGKASFNHKNYSILEGNEWTIKSDFVPVIGIHPDIDEEIYDFLLEEGYLVEVNLKNENYSVYLDNKKNMNLDNKVHILQTIEQTQNMLIRIWRWPDNKKYAFTISGDIDAVVLGDYFDRFKG